MKSVEVAGLLSQSSLSPPLVLPGPLTGGFLHPFRDGILMFSGEGRCRDRISPAFGSVVILLLFLGMFWGFGVYILAHCLHMHSLPPLRCLCPSQRVTSGIKTLPTLSSRGQEQPEDETHVPDKYLLRELIGGHGSFLYPLNRNGAEE